MKANRRENTGPRDAMRERVRVLVVEANAADVDVVREAFPAAGPVGFHIEFAPRLSAALVRLEAGGIDLVLLDLDLPDSQGLDTLLCVRNVAPSVPSIVLMESDDQALGAAAVNAGAQDYLVRSARHALERERAADRERLARDVLDLLNRPPGEEATIRSTLAMVRRRIGLDAVGIRMREGDDFPYRETNGFPERFLESERSLCAVDAAGEILRQRDGRPVLECMCGSVLRGRPDPALPFFSPSGSFWTNSTTDLLASMTEAERQAHTLNRCNREGYESVALIPLKSGDEIVGLLQFHDHRRDRLTPPMIRFFEGLGSSIGIALARRQAQDLLSESELKYRQVVENAIESIFVAQSGRLVFLNAATSAVFGHSGDELLARPLVDFIHPDDRAMVLGRHEARTKGEETPSVYAFRVVHKDGAVRWVEVKAVLVDWQGNPATLNLLSDISDRKHAEEALQESEERLSLALEATADGIYDVDFGAGKTYYSPGYTAMLGYGPAELEPSQETWERLLHPSDKKSALQTLDRCQKGEADRYDMEFRLRMKAGDWRWIQSRGRIVRRDPAGNPLRLVGTHRDITERRQAESERERLFERQIVLNRVTLALGALAELPTILKALYVEARTLLDANGFFISRYRKDSGLITALFVIDDGVERDVSAFPPVPLAPEGRGMQSQVLRTGKPLNVPDWIEGERKMQTVHHIAPDGTFTPPPPETERDGRTKSALLVPLMFQGEPIGVLQVQSNRLNAYSHEDEDLLCGLANVAAISIQNALLIAEARRAADTLGRSLEGTLRAVSRASETRDPYTAGHQQRATTLALAIAHELGLPEAAYDTLRAAGLTHDIGKLGIPAEILSKPGTLAPIELALIREHPQTAYNILADVPFPGPVAEIVLQHHERLDGSGYPRGLKGDQVLREARILAVADVVEAMASHRPYRPARGIDVALGEIEQNAGRLYDSEAVAACIHLFRDKGYALPP